MQPVSPLSPGRGAELITFPRDVSKRGLWAGAFREGSTPFRSARLETIVPIELPFLLFTIREGHLFSSSSPFAFPLDLLLKYGKPGELTILSTKAKLSTLRLVSSAGKKLREQLQRDADLSLVLCERFEAEHRLLSEVFSPELFGETGTVPSMEFEEAQTH